MQTKKTLQNQELLAQVGRVQTAYLNVKNAGENNNGTKMCGEAFVGEWIGMLVCKT